MCEQSLDLLAAIGANGRLCEVNQRWTEVLGWSREQLLERPLEELLHSEDRAAMAVALKRVFAGEDERIDVENRCQREDGEWIWLQWSARYDEALGEVIAAAREVTSSMRLRRMFEQSVDLLCVANLEGIILELNPRWSEVLGYDIDELVGRPFWELVHKEDVGPTIREVKRMERSSHPSSIGFFENRYRKKDGSYLWLQWTGRVDHDLNQLLAVARDVTESRRVSEELIRVADELAQAHRDVELASEAKSRFMANMSHELRTPLNSIMGFAAVLRRREESETRAELLDRIHSAGRHLLSVINDVLDIAKLESGRMELQVEEVDISPIVVDIANVIAVQAAEKGLFLSRRGADKPAVVRASPLAIRQALTNLVGNAVKFTDAGGVEVRIVSDDDGPARIDVSDAGAGIPEEMRGVIFQEFRQADESVGRAHRGTGLGLAIAKQLVEAMGYRLTLTSAVGEGATFSIVFRGDPPGEHRSPAGTALPGPNR
jgi:PAS domain S-box-containing protein